ncbi:unnamed protein product [Penicillium manginii]
MDRGRPPPPNCPAQRDSRQEPISRSAYFEQALRQHKEYVQLSSEDDPYDWSLDWSIRLDRIDYSPFYEQAQRLTRSADEADFWLDALQIGSGDAWIALLLTFLPNLRRLEAEFPFGSLWLHFAMRWAATRDVSSESLPAASFPPISEVYVDWSSHDTCICAEHVMPFFLLPSMRRFYASDLDGSVAGGDDELSSSTPMDGISSVTHIEINGCNGKWDLLKVIGSCKSLQSFKYNHRGCVGYNPAELYGALFPMRETLDTIWLDIKAGDDQNDGDEYEDEDIGDDEHDDDENEDDENEDDENEDDESEDDENEDDENEDGGNEDGGNEDSEHEADEHNDDHHCDDALPSFRDFSVLKTLHLRLGNLPISKDRGSNMSLAHALPPSIETLQIADTGNVEDLQVFAQKLQDHIDNGLESTPALTQIDFSPKSDSAEVSALVERMTTICAKVDMNFRLCGILGSRTDWGSAGFAPRPSPPRPVSKSMEGEPEGSVYSD